MHALGAIIALVVILFSQSFSALGQEAMKPSLKEGDWWRVKRTRTLPAGLSRSGRRCFERYPEFVVKIIDGNAKVFGAKPLETGEQLEESNCETIIHLLLGSGDRQPLKFPLAIGSKWTSRFGVGRRQTVNAETEVKAWEKVKTAKGDLDAFRVVQAYTLHLRTRDTTERVSSYYYAPAAKAIVSYHEKDDGLGYSQTSIVTDFHVSE